MEAKSSAALLAGIMSGVALSLLCVTAALLWEGRSLRGRLDQAAAEADQLRGQQATAESELAAQRDQLAALASEVEQLRLETEAPNTEPASPANAQRARVLVGNRVVGLGWVIGAPTDADGAATSPPGLANVVLDPGFTPTMPTAANASSGRGSDREYSYAYQYESRPYWASYWPWLSTYGWIEWPGCTNQLPPVNGLTPSPANPTPTPSTPTPPANPGPTVVSKPVAVPPMWRTRMPTPAPIRTTPRAVAVSAPRVATPSVRLGPVASRTPALSTAPATSAGRIAPPLATRIPVGTRR